MSRRLLPLPLVMITIVLVAGCGSSGNGIATKTPQEILAATKAAAASASSVHIVTGSRVGQAALSMNASIGTRQGQAELQLLDMRLQTVREGSTLYVKGDQTFSAQLQRALGVKVPANTWIKTPTNGVLAQVAAFTSANTELPVILSTDRYLTKGRSTTINGQPAIELREVAKLYHGTLYVATTGQPYPLLLRKAGEETGETRFTNWNEPVTVDPPPNAIELNRLQHQT